LIADGGTNLIKIRARKMIICLRAIIVTRVTRVVKIAFAIN